MSNRSPHNRHPASSRYGSYPTQPPASRSGFSNGLRQAPTRPLFPPAAAGNVPPPPDSVPSSSWARRDNFPPNSRREDARIRYEPPVDKHAKMYDELAELKKKVAEYEFEEKETIFLQSSHMSMGPAGVSSDSEDDGGAPVRKKQRKASTPEVKKEPKVKKEKKDSDYHRSDRHRKRHRSRTRSRSPPKSKSKSPVYEYLNDDDPFDLYIQPIFKVIDTKPKNTLPDVIVPPIYKTPPLKPQFFNPKDLQYEHIENFFAEISFNDIPEDGIVKFSSRYDPNNLDGYSEYIPANPSPIDWYTITYDDYKAMDHMARTIFYQSDPVKREGFYKLMLINKRDDPQLWIDYLNVQPELDEKRRNDGHQIGKSNIVAKQLEMLVEAKKACSNIVDLDLYEMDLLAKEGKLDDAEMESRWETVINRHLNNLTVWRRKIAAYKSSSKHTVNQILNRCYFRCLKKLGGLLDGSIKSHKLLPGTEEFVLEVLQSAFALLIESGNSQRAVALLQAYVEFYFFAPPQIENQFTKKLEIFKLYWDCFPVKNGGVVKVGFTNAKTWGTYHVSKDLKNYNHGENLPDQPSNIQNLVKAVITATKAVAKTEEFKYLPESVKWAQIEQARSNVAWKPSVCNYDDRGKYYKPLYVPFSEISDALIRYSDTEFPMKAVFSMLVQLGATVPGVDDLSETAMCDITISDLQVFNYEGLDVFFDNVLAAMKPLKAELRLRCTAARLMTYASFVTKQTPKFADAQKQIKDFFLSLYKDGLNKYEKKMLVAFFNEAMNDLCKRHELPNKMTKDMWSKFIAVDSDKLFRNELEGPVLLTDLRFAVTLCRIYPHCSNAEEIEDTKLSVLREMSAKSVEDPAKVEEIRKLWIDARDAILAESDGIGSEHNWSGRIKDYYIELLAILHYETEANPTEKLRAFSSCFTVDMLKENRYLAEVYYSTWFYHSEKYNTPKINLMSKLMETVKIFPLNVPLIRILAQCLPVDEIRFFFADDSLLGSTQDVSYDRIRVLRTIVQFMPLKKVWKTVKPDSLDLAAQTQHFIDLVRETAISASQASMRPDSFLWRLLVYVSVHFGKRGDDITQIYVEARQHCLWSKEFLVYFHLKTCTKLLLPSLQEAETTGQRINYGETEVTSNPL